MVGGEREPSTYVSGERVFGPPLGTFDVEWVAREVQRVLQRYRDLQDIIAILGIDELSEEDKALVARARRLQRFNMHLQIHLDSKLMASMAPALAAMPVPVVIDHMARVEVGSEHAGQAFDALLRLLEQPQLWVKVSALERVCATKKTTDKDLPLPWVCQTTPPL